MPGSLPYSAIYSRNTQELTISVVEGETTRVNGGDWIVMMAVGFPDTLHCRVVEAEYWPKIRVAILPSNQPTVFQPETEPIPGVFPAFVGFESSFPVTFAIYRQNFDELSE